MANTEIPGPNARTFVLVRGIGMGRIVYADVAEVPSERGRVLAVEALVLIAPTVTCYERKAPRQATLMVQDLTGEGPKCCYWGCGNTPRPARSGS